MINKIRFFLKILLVILVSLVIIVIAILLIQGKFSTEIGIPISEKHQNKICGDMQGTKIYERLQSEWIKEDRECFLRDMERLYEYKDVSVGMETITQLLEAQAGLFSDDTAKLEALNYLVPLVLMGNGKKFDVQKYRYYLYDIIQSDDSVKRAKAVMIMGYYRNDADISIFENIVMNSDDSNLIAGIVALANNCSPKAKEALSRVRGSKNVISYRERYGDKEAVTKLIVGCVKQ